MNNDLGCRAVCVADKGKADEIGEKGIFGFGNQRKLFAFGEFCEQPRIFAGHGERFRRFVAFIHADERV